MEVEDRNRKLEADAAAAALEFAASPSTSTPQRQPPFKAKGTDKENAGSSHLNAKSALQVVHFLRLYTPRCSNIAL